MKDKVYALVVTLLVVITFVSNAKTNVVFILADDLGWKDLTCYGSDFYETPNLDAFAESGLLFSNAYAASPLCSPTRASILTGQEPGRLHFTTPSGHVAEVVLNPKETFTAAPYDKVATPQTRTRLPNEYLTFAEVLKQNGYKTAFMGKWHLGRAPYIPENQGFDVVIGGREHPGPPGPGHFFAPWNCENLPLVPSGTHISDVLTDEAIKYMTANKANPFLLCLWYYDVHAPFQAKNDIKQKYEEKLNKKHVQRCSTMGAMIETMDTNIGRVLQSIKDLKLEDETIVIFTSDNGGNMYDGPDGTTPTNNYPLRSGKGSNYEGGVRIPLIVRVPGLTKAGSKSKVVTSTVDHYATILELLNIPFPDTLLTDGVSYVRALNNEKYIREPIYSTFCHNVLATGNRANISMRYGKWRLYKFYYDGSNGEHRYELYNLDKDISETQNLVSKMPQKAQEMIALLDAHAKEANILLPQKNLAYDGRSADAWFGSDNAKISVSNKVMTLVSNGTMPFIETIYNPNVSNDTFKLEFELKSKSTGDGEIAWKVGAEKDYTVLNRTSFKSMHDGKWHHYAIEMPISAMLKSIRIKPSSGEGEMALKNIKLVTKDGYFIYSWPLF